MRNRDRNNKTKPVEMTGIYVAFNKKGGKKDDLYFLLTLAVYWL